MGTTNRPSWRVVDDIAAEREYQVNENGYTQDHDDNVFPHQWLEFIQKYLGQADAAREPEQYRKQLVKVAALAVAAIESYDRLS